MSDAFFRCSHCREKLSVDEGLVGTRVECPACRNETEVSRPSVFFRCASCHTDLAASEDLRGVECTCPRCSTDGTVPLAAESGRRSPSAPKPYAAPESEPLSVLNRCPKCRIQVPPDAALCPRCGTQIPSGAGLGADPLVTGWVIGLGIAAVLLLLGLAGWLVHRSAVPQTPPPHATPVVAMVTAAPPTAVAQPPPSDAVAKGRALFGEFTNQVVAGATGAAAGTLARLRLTFPTETEYYDFLSKVISPAHAGMLIEYAVCTACTTGECAVCHGSGVCAACRGSPVCTNCSGAGKLSLKCTACLCPACGGKGACPSCFGRKQVQCPTCNGTGLGRQVMKNVTCRKCGGRGYLLNELSRSQAPCPYCNHRGYTAVPSWENCGACGGRGVAVCTRCSGSGQCPTCGGRGRIANCPKCGGKGGIVQVCPACAGAGQCRECRGSGRCAACAGTGTCPKCGASGLVRVRDLPIDLTWFKGSPGYFREDEGGRPGRDIVPAAGPTRLVWHGREVAFDVGSNRVIRITQPAPGTPPATSDAVPAAAAP